MRKGIFKKEFAFWKNAITRIIYILRNVVIDIPNSISPKANNTKKISRKCECVLTFGMDKLPNEIKIKIMLIIDIKLFTVSYNFLYNLKYISWFKM